MMILALWKHSCSSSFPEQHDFSRLKNYMQFEPLEYAYIVKVSFDTIHWMTKYYNQIFMFNLQGYCCYKTTDIQWKPRIGTDNFSCQPGLALNWYGK